MASATCCHGVLNRAAFLSRALGSARSQPQKRELAARGYSIGTEHSRRSSLGSGRNEKYLPVAGNIYRRIASAAPSSSQLMNKKVQAPEAVGAFSPEVQSVEAMQEAGASSEAATTPASQSEGGDRRRYRLIGDIHKAYEENSKLLPGCWIVVRVDGRAFHRFVEVHRFARPHDRATIGLMDATAKAVAEEFADIMLAYGQSDEYSFVFHKDTDIYSRRSSKFSSLIASLFTSHFVLKWPSFFDTPLKLAPSFDGRAVCYPSAEMVRDYLAWRQLDCHTNCLFTTCYWTLVDRGGKTGKEADKILNKASKGFKNELLFTDFGINYNDLPSVFKRGTLLLKRRERVELRTKEATPYTPAGTPYFRTVTHVDAYHEDVAQGDFWLKHCSALFSDQTGTTGSPENSPVDK